MATATAITLDREVVERFIIEVDAIGILDSIRNDGNETALEWHVYRVLGEFERAALGSISDEEGTRLHEQARERAEELARKWFGNLYPELGQGG